jgi:subtilase family serine protease
VRFTVSLRQRNLATLKAKVLARSDPKHLLYGKWLSKRAIEELIAPSKKERKKLASTLRRRYAIRVVKDQGDSLVLRASAKAIEQAFSTQLGVFQESEEKLVISLNANYSIPTDLALIESISDLPMLPVSRAHLPKPNILGGDLIIPSSLRNMYQVPDTEMAGQRSSLALVEFMNYSAFKKLDLTYFLNQTGEPEEYVQHIVGQYIGSGLESTLDVQQGRAMARGADVYFWTGARWLLDWAQNFFSQDEEHLPLVASISWGLPSASQCTEPYRWKCGNGVTPEDYVKRVEVEFMKLAGRGVTLFAGSGDMGAPGDLFLNCETGLSDAYPGSSEWVTSVGATMLSAQGPVGGNATVCREYAPCVVGSDVVEVVCS